MPAEVGFGLDDLIQRAQIKTERRIAEAKDAELRALLNLINWRLTQIEVRLSATAAGEPVTGRSTTPTCGSTEGDGGIRINKAALEVAAWALHREQCTDELHADHWPTMDEEGKSLYRVAAEQTIRAYLLTLADQ